MPPFLGQRLTPGPHRTLLPAQSHRDALLLHQLLPHHLAVAVVLLELLLQPLPVPIDLARAVGSAVRLPAPSAR